jgi:hypothetical protein
MRLDITKNLRELAFPSSLKIVGKYRYRYRYSKNELAMPTPSQTNYRICYSIGTGTYSYSLVRTVPGTRTGIVYYTGTAYYRLLITKLFQRFQSAAGIPVPVSCSHGHFLPILLQIPGICADDLNRFSPTKTCSNEN